MAVGLPAKTTYANGDVFSASDINDTNGTINLIGQTTNFYAGKNKIINGDFGIWQRGTSITCANNVATYVADRFAVGAGYSSGSTVASRQTFTPGTAPVAGYEGSFFLRVTNAAGGSPSPYLDIAQRVEDVRVFAGQTVTLSFWAKASVSTNLNPLIRQNFGSGGSSNVDSSPTAQTATTSWARYSFTLAIPSISGKTIGTSSYLEFYLLNGFYAANQTIDIWGVQFEAGSTATAFQTATGTIQGELAACQRYYYRTGVGTGSTTPRVYEPLGYGSFSGTTNFACQVEFPVSMRVAVNTLDYANIAVNDTAAVIAGTGIIVNEGGTKASNLNVTVASGGTQYRFGRLVNNNSTAGYLAWSAEL